MSFGFLFSASLPVFVSLGRLSPPNQEWKKRKIHFNNKEPIECSPNHRQESRRKNNLSTIAGTQIKWMSFWGLPCDMHGIQCAMFVWLSCRNQARAINSRQLSLRRKNKIENPHNRLERRLCRRLERGHSLQQQEKNILKVNCEDDKHFFCSLSLACAFSHSLCPFQVPKCEMRCLYHYIDLWCATLCCVCVCGERRKRLGP